MSPDQKGPRVADPIDVSLPKTDPRVADLQTQIDDLRLALQDWKRSREYSPPAEERLVQITLQCARMVESWQQMERRHPTGTPGPDEDRGAVESRLQATGERLRALERAIEHEWTSLPDGRDDSARRLSAAANLTLRGFASVESRLAVLEQDLQVSMAQLSRDLQALVAELRGARQQSSSGAASAFPLESVMRIHQELRESDTTAGAAPEALKAGTPRALPEATESGTALVARVESLERAAASAADAAAQPSGGWRPLYLVVGLIVALAGVALFGVWMQRRVETRLNEAAARVSEAERQRDATNAATRVEAARQVAAAQQSASQAQIIGNVLAAPDRVRYWLTAVDTNSRAYAQVQFSRSRGMVFSASRLPAPGAGKTYQLWLLTRGGPVSAGLIAPDSAGRVTLATDVPAALPGRLSGALVTLEPEGGSPQPSEEKALVRVE
jgi:Anti-sigma-K factor rskA